MSQQYGKYRFDELVKLRYDIAVDIYRQRAKALEVQTASKHGRNLEYWIYRTFPQLISSLAITLNPYWQFDRQLRERSNQILPGLYRQIPVPVNRVRSFNTIFPQNIRSHSFYGIDTVGVDRRWDGHKWIYHPYSSNTIQRNSDVHLGVQNAVMGFRKDTTWKTRNPGAGKIPFNRAEKDNLGLQAQGEFELWIPKFEASSAGVNWSCYDHYTDDSNSPPTWKKVTYNHMESYWGPCGSVDPQSVSQIAVQERVNALRVLAANADALVSGSLPGRRKYSLLYNVAELKDVPLMLRSTIASWRDIESLFGRDGFLQAITKPSFWTRAKVDQVRPLLAKAKVNFAPDISLSNAYLNFKFGWMSCYQALVGLLGQPSKVAKEVNTLLKQDGKLMTLHRKMTLSSEQLTSLPTITLFNPYGFAADPSLPFSCTGTREIELRSVVNFGVQLPPLDPPALRDKVFREKLGVSPRPSDIYNLVPWTWLIDWFVGFGQYLSLLEQILSDPTIINYGLLTYESRLRAVATKGVKVDTSNYVHSVSKPSFTDAFTVKTQLSGLFTASYVLRLDVGSLTSMKLTSGRGLSQDQMSIMSALLSKFGRK